MPLEELRGHFEGITGEDSRDILKMCDLGPVVQSIVSLTTSLRRQLVKYMLTILSNTLLFFVGKM